MTKPKDQTEQEAQDGRNDEAINGPNPPKWIHFFYYQELKDQLAKEREKIKELESKLEYANALVAKYTPKDYGIDDPEFTHPDETED